MATQVQTKKFGTGITIIGILAIILLMAFPLFIIKDSEFGGSDGAGSETVAAIAPEYNAEWIGNWWEPPGGETESMLFALQATAGGILIGYFFGFLRGQKKGREEVRPDKM
jgi:cobalt/nickel transport protein